MTSAVRTVRSRASVKVLHKDECVNFGCIAENTWWCSEILDISVNMSNSLRII